MWIVRLQDGCALARGLVVEPVEDVAPAAEFLLLAFEPRFEAAKSDRRTGFRSKKFERTRRNVAFLGDPIRGRCLIGALALEGLI